MSSPRGLIRELSRHLSLHEHTRRRRPRSRRHADPDGDTNDDGDTPSPQGHRHRLDPRQAASAGATPMRVSLSSPRSSTEHRHSHTMDRAFSDVPRTHPRTSFPHTPVSARTSTEVAPPLPPRTMPRHFRNCSAPPGQPLLTPPTSTATPAPTPAPALTPATEPTSNLAPAPAHTPLSPSPAPAPRSLNPFSDLARVDPIGTPSELLRSSEEQDACVTGLAAPVPARTSTSSAKPLSPSPPSDPLPPLTPSVPADSEPDSESPPTPRSPRPKPSQADNNRAVIKFGPASLNAFDWMSLGPKEWLSDNVLAFWFALIEAQLAERDPKTAGKHAVTKAALWPPSLVELLTALPQDVPRKQARTLFPPPAPVVVLPVNNGYSKHSRTAPEPGSATHWSVLIITRADEGRKATARHYDSHTPTNAKVARRVWQLWCRIFAPGLTGPASRYEVASELAPQKNAWDCGPYVLGVTTALLLGSSPHPRDAVPTVRKIQPADVARYRTAIHEWLERWLAYSTARQQAASWDMAVAAVGPMPMLVTE